MANQEGTLERVLPVREQAPAEALVEVLLRSLALDIPAGDLIASLDLLARQTHAEL